MYVLPAALKLKAQADDFICAEAPTGDAQPAPSAVARFRVHGTPAIRTHGISHSEIPRGGRRAVSWEKV